MMDTANIKQESNTVNDRATDGAAPTEKTVETEVAVISTPNKAGETTDKTKEAEKKDTTKNAPDITPNPVSRPSYIPPHLMGRDLNNPAQDMIGTGRRVQKPRLGVKVPYRNLTSQIVSQDEIAQEILERSLRKYSYSEVPEGGDVFFAMKLTHRLANKITPANDSSIDKATDSAAAKKTDGIENVITNDNPTPTKIAVAKAKEPERKNDTPVASKSTIAEKSKTIDNSTKITKASEAIPSKDVNKNDSSVNFESKADQLYAEITSTLGEECKISKAPKVTSPNATSCPKTNSKMNGTISLPVEPEIDNDTLLAILEGTSDISDVSMNATASTPNPKVEAKPRKKRIKPLLDPNVEKELALKQLMDFEKKKKEDKLKKTEKKLRPDEEAGVNPQLNNSQNTTADASATADTTQDSQKSAETSKTEPTPKKIRRNPFNSGSAAPKRFPKKYQRIIKRQLRSSKMKVKTASPDQQKKLPEVPEVQIAIDRYIKTYASKRKLRPEPEEKPAEKKLKEDHPNKPEEPTEVVKTADPPVPTEADENRKDSGATIDEEIKENESPSNAKPKANAKVMREINRLLGDEGAINMIYSIEQKRLPDNRRDANILPSLRRKKKDLLLKTKLVKNAVLRLSMSPSQITSGRVRRTSPELSQSSKSAISPSRKTSMESVDSNISEHTPKVRKVAAEASRIIRRHSSSSAYSSEDEETEPKTKSADKVVPPPAPTVTESEPSKEQGATPVTDQTPAKANEVVIETNNNESPVKESKIREKDDKAERKESAGTVQVGSTKRKNSKEEVAEVKTTNDVPTPSSSNSELVEQLSLKEITVRRYDSLVQIILISSSSKMKNAMNIQVFTELTNVLRELQKDENCRTVLVTSTGSSFCQGVDLQALICSDKEERTKIVNEYVTALMNFTKSLSQFKKVLIAGVHGSAVGLGVTMLPFFDMVFASDKATFYTPYVKLGQIPEAGSTLTLPHLLGNAVTSELLFGCRMLTASEALTFGLVTRILWPDKFSEELLPIARGVAGHSSQSMEATKSLLRQGMNEKLEEQLNTEAKLLQEHWCSEECQKRFKEYLQQEALLQNK